VTGAAMRRCGPIPTGVPAPVTHSSAKVVSWNLLHTVGARIEEVARLVQRERPALFLMQEATEAMDRLPDLIGGHYFRSNLPGRIHGLAAWSPHELRVPPVVLPLQRGAMFRRVCLLLDCGGFTVANVHLSHGQVLNRRQLRTIARSLPERAAILGDFNMLGHHLLPGFRDVGPREATHVSGDVVPVRLDRCLARGLACTGARTLMAGRSDHRPILVHLAPSMEERARAPWFSRIGAALGERRQRLQMRLDRQPAKDAGKDAA